MARNEKDQAVRVLRLAAAREDSLGKHPVSPGALLPVRELLAEALLESGSFAAALAEYEASLRIYPARFNGVSAARREPLPRPAANERRGATTTTS